MSNHQSTINEDQKSQPTTNRRPFRSELLKKIYYPNSFNSDTYTFVVDREPSPMETNEPPSTTDSRKPSGDTSTVPKQVTVTNEIEMTERQSRNLASMLDRERGESDPERRRFDVKRYIPAALRAQDKTQPAAVLLDTRFYSMKKTAMTIMCLLIIIMSNSVQLKHVLKQGHSHQFYGTQVFLGILSVLMCACIGVILMYVIRIDVNDQYKQHKLDYIDNCIICLVFILAIFNIFIAACS